MSKAQKKLQTNVFFHFVIVLISCPIAQGYLFHDYDNICGKNNSKVRILHEIDGEWKIIDVSYLIHAKAVLTYADAVSGLQSVNLQVRQPSESEKIEHHDVSEVFIHPDYNSLDGSKNFAILRLKTPFPANYGPICLINQNAVRNCSKEGSYSAVYSATKENGNCRKMIGPFAISRSQLRLILCHMKRIEPELFRKIEAKTLMARAIERDICMIPMDRYDYRQCYHSHVRDEQWCHDEYNVAHPDGYFLDNIANARSWISRILDQIEQKNDDEDEFFDDENKYIN